RILQLHVLGWILRNVGDRTRSFLALLFTLDVTLQVGLTTPYSLVLEIVRQRLPDLDVGRDAFALDRFTGRRVVERRGQAQRAILAERDDRLDRTLAERLGADHGRAAMILQRTGHDFGRARRTAVDQHDHWLAVGDVT